MVKTNNFNPECITKSQMNMIFNTRIYYRRLMTVTRSYLTSRYFGIGDENVLYEILYRESLDVASLLRLNFGRSFSDRYSQLVSQFPITLRDLISAQLEGNTEEINRSVERLYQNINERAAYLASVNPYFSEAGYRDVFGTYIQLTIEQINALASGNFKEDIELFDQLTAHANLMGDVLSEGLYNYITSGSQNAENLPAQESEQCITYEQMNTIQNIRMFWFDLALWLRRYLISRYTGIGDSEEIYNRMRQVPVNYTNELKLVFGEKFATDFLPLLNEYLDLVDDYITAQKEGNIDEINRIIQLLTQNVENRARLQASYNPFFNETDWRNRLYSAHVRSVIDLSTSYLTGDYARGSDIYIRLLDQAESNGEFYAQGLFDFFNSQTQQ